MSPEDSPGFLEEVEATKVIRADGKSALKVHITREVRALGLDMGDEVVVTLRRRN